MNSVRMNSVRMNNSDEFSAYLLRPSGGLLGLSWSLLGPPGPPGASRGLPGRLAARLAAWLPGLLPAWLAGRLAAWPAGCLAGWLAGWLAAWLAGWLPGLLPAWLAARPASRARAPVNKTKETSKKISKWKATELYETIKRL